MKRRIFTLLAAAALMFTASAQNAGDYFYTSNGRYKITTGENLLANGDFSDGTAGWTTDGGQALNTDTFSIEPNGPEGKYNIVVNLKDNGPGTGSSLLRAQQVMGGQSYVVTYQVKGNDEDVLSTVVTGDNVKNYQNIFFNEDASLTPFADGGQIATSQTYGWDWTTVAYGFRAPVDGYIVFHFYAPYIGTAFADFRIMTASEVVDDREAAKVIARLQAYIDNPLFPNGHDILEGVIGALQMYVETDDVDGYNEISQYIDTAIAEFLDLNTANITTYLKNGNFDNLKATSANQRAAGAWSIDDITEATGKTRWSVKDAMETGAPFQGLYLQDDFPYPYLLREATVHQTIDDMPAAQYMFSVKMRAHRLLNKNGDLTTDIEGMKVFINDDSTECTPVEAENPVTYTAYSTLSETGALRVGFFLPDSVSSHVDLDVVDLRIIGWSQEDVDQFFMGKEFAEARQLLKHTIDSAQVWLENVEMLYGKPQLDSAIVASRDYYDNITVTDSLTASDTRLKKEISSYISRNSTLTTFRQAIANAEALVADGSYSEADRKALQDAIDTAKTYLATLSADNHRTAGFTNDDIKAQTQVLNDAVNALLSSKLRDDEQYQFLTWAGQDGAEFISTVVPNEEDAITTSSGATLYPETGLFAGHDLSSRFAFLAQNMNVTLQPTHGLQVNFTSKNQVSMAITDLKEGDQITMDWTMGNASHNIMVVSANAKVELADGSVREYVKTGKNNDNILPNDNSDGLSGTCRSRITMTADGTLDIYQSSSNSTIRIAYVGISDPNNNETETGDVNGDGAVDVADISSIISVMAGGSNDLAADVNGDGAVDVADISAVISIMAGK